MRIGLLLILYSLSLWVSLLKAQSRINIEIHDIPSRSVVLSDSATLYENTLVNPGLIRLLQQPPGAAVTLADSLQVEQILLQIRGNIGVYGRLVREKKETDNLEKLNLLRETDALLEKGLLKKPADVRLARYVTLLSPPYESLLRKEDDHRTFVAVATRHLLFSEPEKKYSILYALGDAYSRLDEIALSRAAFDQTIHSLFTFYADSLNAGNQQYLTFLYRSLTGRGAAEEKLYLNSAALRSWRHALVVAPPAQKANIEAKINRTLLWDDGNLRALEKRTQATQLIRDKDYVAAKSMLLGVLPELVTFLARADINRLIAQIDFSSLENTDAGLERMQQIILEFPRQMTVADSTIDSTYQDYLETYAQLCYFQGAREMRLDHTREAFIYFAKVADFKNKFQALANYSLAYLLARDTNSVLHSEKIIACGLQAWDGELSDAYRTNLATTISSAYQQQGNFERAVTWKNRALALDNSEASQPESK